MMSAVLDALWIASHVTDQASASTRTTLFELISALQDAAGPDNDVIVLAAVIHLLQTGRIRFLDGIGSIAPLVQEQMPPAKCH
jgi:hypothetical protein